MRSSGMPLVSGSRKKLKFVSSCAGYKFFQYLMTYMNGMESNMSDAKNMYTPYPMVANI